MKKTNYAMLAKNYKDICNMSSSPEWYGSNYYLVELPDGSYFEEMKPRIETRFCFGAGQNGISTLKEDEEAEDMAQHARTNQDYFIKSNLSGLESSMKDLYSYKEKLARMKNADDTCYAYHIPYLCKNRDGVYSLSYLNPTFGNFQSRLDSGLCRRLTNEDIDVLVKFYDSIIEQFTKRLNTYLKRYGLSKVVSWTYICD